MTSEMRRQEEKSGVYLESILSLCLPTLCTSAEVLGRLQRDCLRRYLECLVKWIEQQLSSSMTFNMKFSWRLPRGVYPYAVRRCLSSSSTECIELELPMKILDDLAVCRMRAKLRAEAVLQTGPTPAEACGKRVWARLQQPLVNMVEEGFRSVGGDILTSYVERDVILTATLSYGAKSWNIMFRGRIDFAVLVNLKSSIFVLLVEVTEYRDAPLVVRSRLQAYASALYGELGFPVVPVLVIVGEREKIEDMRVLVGRSLIPGIELRRSVYRLIRTLAGEEVVRAPSSDLCAVCDPSIRRLCPYQH